MGRAETKSFIFMFKIQKSKKKLINWSQVESKHKKIIYIYGHNEKKKKKNPAPVHLNTNGKYVHKVYRSFAHDICTISV